MLARAGPMGPPPGTRHMASAAGRAPPLPHTLPAPAGPPCASPGGTAGRRREPRVPLGLAGHRNQQVTDNDCSPVWTKACRRPCAHATASPGGHGRDKGGQRSSLQWGSRPVRWACSRRGKEGAVRVPQGQGETPTNPALLPKPTFCPHNTLRRAEPLPPASAEAFTEINTWRNEHKIKDLQNLLTSATGPRWQLPPPLPGVGGRQRRGWQGAEPRLLAQRSTLGASVSRGPGPHSPGCSAHCCAAGQTRPASLLGATGHPRSRQKGPRGGLLAEHSHPGPDGKAQGARSLCHRAGPPASPTPRGTPAQTQGKEREEELPRCVSRRT